MYKFQILLYFYRVQRILPLVRYIKYGNYNIVCPLRNTLYFNYFNVSSMKFK